MMARDPIKTARNRKIMEMKDELRHMLPQVLKDTGIKTEASLNAMIGGKAAHFIDLMHEVILSPDQYATLYMKGFKRDMTPDGAPFPNSHRRNFNLLKRTKLSQKYFMIFLKRSYLKHYEELSKTRPQIDQSEIWIGQNKADYGLLITPRYVNGIWENDKSEIRHFPKLYWTIGHVLHSGLVVQGDEDKLEFPDVNAYLTFFKNTLVRTSGSPHEKAIAKLYVDYVRVSNDPESVPLLIPEYRYEGAVAKHRYRLDFCIIDPYTMRKVGYELSPWSTHGYLSALKGLTQNKINQMASDNFEKEMVKHRAFFKKHEIYSLIYTDSQLSKIDEIFEDMKKYLNPVDKIVQLDFNLLEEFFK